MKNWEKWEEYNHEWFRYKMERTYQSIEPSGFYNNPCLTCSYPNCTFCPIIEVRHERLSR